MAFLITLLNCIILHGERLLGKIGGLPFTAHCRFLHTILIIIYLLLLLLEEHVLVKPIILLY